MLFIKNPTIKGLNGLDIVTIEFEVPGIALIEWCHQGFEVVGVG